MIIMRCEREKHPQPQHSQRRYVGNTTTTNTGNTMAPQAHRHKDTLLPRNEENTEIIINATDMLFTTT